MQVIKRDGTLEEYNEDKIRKVLCAAFDDLGERCDEWVIDNICKNIHVADKISIDSIQMQIENQLMNINKKVAKAFILYKEEQKGLSDVVKKRDFIKDYINASNAATGSKFDPNANVSNKNIATLSQELYKENIIKLNRFILSDKISKMYGKKLAKEYIRQLESHEIYKHDESSLLNYCASITMYPFLLNGLVDLGGESKAPKSLKSFSGSFINLVFAVSSQLAGACSTPEWLLYTDYFIRKDYGDDYLNKLHLYMEVGSRNRTLEQIIEDTFQQVVYSMNQPAAARGYQSVFWNISYYDKQYFEGIFGDFKFPDGTAPKWETLDWLQRKFMKWFNSERTKSLLTFPVETMAMLTDGKDVVDKEYADFTAEMYSEGHSFFTYLSDSPDSLSSCCRLRSELTDNQFSFSLGAGGVATGSKSVMTINVNRLVQNAVNEGKDIFEFLKEQVLKIHKYQTAYNEIIKDYNKANMLPIVSAGYISLNKQYLTIGVNGVVEAAEFLGYEISDNDKYKDFINKFLTTINECNKAAKTKELMFNTEFVPGESLGVKHARWDKIDGYIVPRDCYNSYFYKVEDESLNVLDRFALHGKDYVDRLDGGSACHNNLREHLSKEQYRQLLKVASENGTNYFTFNVKNTICNKCGNIDKRTLDTCPKCGSSDTDKISRVIGYLKRISSYSEPRQVEESKRYYA